MSRHYTHPIPELYMYMCILACVFHVLELSLEEKQYEYECQIRSLEDEVRLLEDELKRRDLPLDDIKDHQLEQAMLVQLTTVYVAIEVLP